MYRLFLNFCFPGKSQKLLYQGGASLGCLRDGIDLSPTSLLGAPGTIIEALTLDDVEKIV